MKDSDLLQEVSDFQNLLKSLTWSLGSCYRSFSLLFWVRNCLNDGPFKLGNCI